MAIEIPQYNVTITVTAGFRYSGWETKGETRLNLDVSSLEGLPKVGAITEGLLKAAVIEHGLKVAEEALQPVVEEEDES
jgi:hypothetical protein